MSGIIHTVLGAVLYWKVKTQPVFYSYSTYGEIHYGYKASKKTKYVRLYMESLALRTGSPTVHWEYNTSCVYVVESKRVTPRVKHINIPVVF